MVDISYSSDALFTSFYPESKAGEKAWNELHEAGATVMPTVHRDACIAALRKAGYVVRKQAVTKITIKDADSLLAELSA